MLPEAQEMPLALIGEGLADEGLYLVIGDFAKGSMAQRVANIAVIPLAIEPQQE